MLAQASLASTATEMWIRNWHNPVLVHISPLQVVALCNLNSSRNSRSGY